MRKTIAILCAVVLLPGFLTACEGHSSRESRVELTRSGKIIEYTVDNFSASNYNLDELKEFIDAEIDAYTVENKGRIKVKRERVRRNKAYLTIRYNKPETYALFNGVECFAGTVTEAMEAGYDFSMYFTMYIEEEEETEDGEESAGETVGEFTVSGSDAIADKSLKVFIVETDAGVTVPGDVLYFYSSAGEAQWESKDTVSINVEEDVTGVRNVVYVLYE